MVNTNYHLNQAKHSLQLAMISTLKDDKKLHFQMLYQCHSSKSYLHSTNDPFLRVHTDYLNGWVCFVISIIWIGILTALIGDLASHLGCTIGLKDTITAIALVALGTSVPEIWGGWACFVASIAVIGLLTAVIGDLASHFGCTVGIKDSITAISLVALGTSLPDTFASKVAAINDKYADSSIGNVTGSNAVNVFLGIGIAWTIASIYHAFHGNQFKVDPGDLAFSVTIFCICAGICCFVLLFRRWVLVGGELGGSMKCKAPTTILLVGLWLFYVLVSSLKVYGISIY